MKNFKIYHGLIVALLATNLYQNDLNQKLQSEYLYEVEKLEASIDEISCTYDSLKVSVHENPEKKTKDPKQKKQIKSSLFNLDCFHVQRYVDPILDTRLFKALMSYSGPKALVTSARRLHCKHSKHFTGKAIDIRLNDSGKEMLAYLVSPAGKNWCKSKGISFLIENKPGSKSLSYYKEHPIYKDYVYENPGASSLHIHLYLGKSIL